VPIPIKSPCDIAAMGRAGALAWRIVAEAVESARAGVTTAELDNQIAARIAASGAEAILKGFRRSDGPGFPACSSICVNEEVVHGVPGDRILRDGDLVTIDLALRQNGWCADVARALVIGPRGDGESRSERAAASQSLAQGAARCVSAGLSAMAAGRQWSEVAGAVAREAGVLGVCLVGAYAGHGIGRDLHEPPEAWLGDGAPTRDASRAGTPATGPEGTGGQDFVLRPGMVLTLEPIVMEGPGAAAGRAAMIALDGGWTVLAGDRRRACHEERTVAITRGGPVVLTGTA
jgi:methionyl aminopeptidase